MALQAQIDAVNAQIEYVKSISAAFSTPGGLSPSGLQTIVDKTYDLADAAVAAYIETLRDQVGVDADGNPIYQYEFGYITTLMLGEPTDLTYEQYLALIAVFEEMDIENKERFIEASYINYDIPDTYAFTDGYRVFNWEISSVFQTMAVISQIELANTEITFNNLILSDDPDYLRINNKVFSSSLLMNIALYGKNYIVAEPDGSILMYSQDPLVNIEIAETNTERVDKFPFDYSISGGGFSFSIYQYRDDLDKLLDEIVVKENINRLAPSVSDTVIGNVVTILETGIGLVPVYGEVIGVAIAVPEIIMSIRQDSIDRQIAEYADRALDDGNAARALFIGGSVTVSQDGGITSYSIGYMAIDTEALVEAFEVYEKDTGKQLTVDSLVNGTASQADVDAYLSWYTTRGRYLINKAQ